MTLYQETTCEHGQMRSHLYGEQSGEEFPVGENMLHCPGGFREEVTIDYEAAANRIGKIKGMFTDFADERRAKVELAKDVIHTGLGDSVRPIA